MKSLLMMGVLIAASAGIAPVALACGIYHSVFCRTAPGFSPATPKPDGQVHGWLGGLKAIFCFNRTQPKHFHSVSLLFFEVFSRRRKMNVQTVIHGSQPFKVLSPQKRFEVKA